MNSHLLRALAATALSLGLLACPLDGGGGGGGGTINFSEGYVFVRREDRNVYLTDKSDYAKVGQLTTLGGARHPALSKDGRKVVWVQGTGNEAVLTVRGSSGGSAESRVLSSTIAEKDFKYPVFSPDGTRIAFTFQDGNRTVIGILNADGSGSLSKLSGDPARSYSAPSFYPDGKSVLAAVGSSPAAYTGLAKLAVDTGTATDVTNTLGSASQLGNRVLLSPDGTRAAFDGRLSGGSTAVRIFVIELSTKKVTQVTDYPGEPTALDGFPSWSPGDKVSFSSNTGGADSVYALPSTAEKTSGGLVFPSGLEPFYGPW